MYIYIYIFFHPIGIDFPTNCCLNLYVWLVPFFTRAICAVIQLARNWGWVFNTKTCCSFFRPSIGLCRLLCAVLAFHTRQGAFHISRWIPPFPELAFIYRDILSVSFFANSPLSFVYLCRKVLDSASRVKSLTCYSLCFLSEWYRNLDLFERFKPIETNNSRLITIKLPTSIVMLNGEHTKCGRQTKLKRKWQ